MQSLINDLQARVTSDGPKLLPIGGDTKSALGAVRDDQGVEKISMTELSGIIKYEPSEYLITVRSGTRIRDIQQALAEHRQYLPFDPLFVDAGATLGGTIASGIGGGHQLLFGAPRDFVMEVELIDGLGKLVRGGGKVVKNAAGLDLPKLVVGSLGRLGILTELTVKVLPRPEAVFGVMTRLQQFADAVPLIQKVISNPLPLSAIDVDAAQRMTVLFAGPKNSRQSVEERFRRLLPTQQWEEATTVPQVDRETLQQTTAEQILVRVAMDRQRVPELAEQVLRRPGLELHSFSVAGTVGWILADDMAAINDLDAGLKELDCTAITVRGPIDRMRLLGHQGWTDMANLVQRSIDPNQRFLDYH